jgi:hypothetical protein
MWAHSGVPSAHTTHYMAYSPDYSLMDETENPCGEYGWRWCRKCSVISFTGAGIPLCSDGKPHDHSGSGHYSITKNQSAFPGPRQWHRCKKCQGLGTTLSKLQSCKAGGDHDYTGSLEYIIPVDGLPSAKQGQWRSCDLCSLLAFDDASFCAAGGAHILLVDLDYAPVIDELDS